MNNLMKEIEEITLNERQRKQSLKSRISNIRKIKIKKLFKKIINAH